MRGKIFTQTNFKEDIYTKAWYITKNNFIKGSDKINQLEGLNKMIVEMCDFGYINRGLYQDLTQLITLLKLNVYHDFDKDKEMPENE